MRKIIIVGAILLLLYWLWKKKQSTESESGTDTGTGTDTVSGAGLVADINDVPLAGKVINLMDYAKNVIAESSNMATNPEPALVDPVAVANANIAALQPQQPFIIPEDYQMPADYQQIVAMMPFGGSQLLQIQIHEFEASKFAVGNQVRFQGSNLYPDTYHIWNMDSGISLTDGEVRNFYLDTPFQGQELTGVTMVKS